MHATVTAVQAAAEAATALADALDANAEIADVIKRQREAIKHLGRDDVYAKLDALAVNARRGEE